MARTNYAWMAYAGCHVPCQHRSDCVSPRGHYGPCAVAIDGVHHWARPDGTFDRCFNPERVKRELSRRRDRRTDGAVF